MRAAVLGLAVLLLGTPAVGQGVNADSVQAACVRADSSRAWRQADAVWKAAHAGWAPRDTALLRRLLRLDSLDQAMRTSVGFMDSVKSQDFLRRFAARDSADLAELRQIVIQHGWPTISMVGPEGAEAAWTIAQHGDSAWQHATLERLRALPATEVRPSLVAMMDDRLEVARGRPQLYGTQLTQGPDGRLVFNAIQDVPHLDQRRAALGMPPLRTYACTIRGVYGQEVVLPPGY